MFAPIGAHVMAHPDTGERSLGIFLGLGDEPRRWWEPLPVGGDELAVARPLPLLRRALSPGPYLP
ncbi:MAG: hypothetical protein R2705_07435 [Ilumatobacteraceae bacterium]